MTKYHLSKQSQKQEIILNDKKLPQVVKQSLIIGKKTCELFIKTVEISAKTTQAIFDWIGKKLADIDYEKIFAEFLKSMAEENSYDNTYTYYETVTYTTTRYKKKRVEPEPPIKTDDGGEIDLIEVKEYKKIPHKKTHKISGKRKKNIPQEKILMLEKKNNI